MNAAGERARPANRVICWIDRGELSVLEETVVTNAILWRRLDTPGHDVCRLETGDAGWRLTGSSVFLEGAVPALLAYQVECDVSWASRWGTVAGWIGDRAVEMRIERVPGDGWLVNGEPMSELDDCVDLDLGFTPATNLLAIRRLTLEVGQASEAPAVWLDLSAATLQRLPQRYERRSDTTYWYEAPTVGYSAMLEVTTVGFVRRYPGLWEAED